MGSDYEMWLRIARRFELGVVDQPLLMYRHHASMSTRGLGLTMCNGVPWEVAVLNKILRLYPQAIDELGRPAVNRRMSKPYAGLASTQFRLRDYRNARSLLGKAISYWPTNYRYRALYAATFLHPAQIAVARRLYRKLSPSRTARETGPSQATST